MRRSLSACVLLVVLVVSCGSADTPTAAPTVTVTMTAGPTPGPTVSAGPFATPDQMLAKVRGLRFVTQCSAASYNLAGALSIGCIGRNGEAIYLDTFPDQAIGESIMASGAMPGGKFHLGPGWLLTCQDAQSLTQLVAALEA